LAGSRGTMGCLSFFPSKNLGAYGDAGMVTTNDASLAERLSILRVHGAKPKYYHRTVGVNSRLDTLQAAILRVKLPLLDGWTRARRTNASRYDTLFGRAGAESSALGFQRARLPLVTPEPTSGAALHIYNQYVVRVPVAIRDALREHLNNCQIGTEVYYPVPLHLQACFADVGYSRGDLPESESAAAETLALPVYPELNQEQLDHVVSSVLGFVQGRAGG
jgi:dTDP-4-amino-4,6-dideoxygalactose transaminase